MAAQKNIITPDHFKVAPEVLGLPLASPSRRLWAMLVDVLLVALLVKAGGMLLGLVAAFMLFRASSTKQPSGSFVRASVRVGLRLTAAIVLFVVIANVWDNTQDRLTGIVNNDDDDDESAAVVATPDGDLKLNIPARELPALAGAIFTIGRGEDSTAVRAAAQRVLATARAAGASRRQLVETRNEIVDLIDAETRDSADIRAVDAALVDVTAGMAALDANAKRIAATYLAALQANDSVTLALYEDSARALIAGPEMRRLDSVAVAARAARDSALDQLRRSEDAHGLRYYLRGAADDLGVGFGWSAVFFTAFLALWRGQTPGKRLAGVRVLRLDGKPLGWWMSFERFGGYAASASVGLLGFFQILWDRNRQGLHDKACETVVVLDSERARAIG